MQYLIDTIHSLESTQVNLRVRHQFEAARSLDITVFLLRKELELETASYDRIYETRLKESV